MSFEMGFVIEQDPCSLSKIALVEAYQNISSHHYKQKELIEKYKQKIFTLEQEKTLRDSVQQDELQTLTENFDRELESAKKKWSIENKDLHNRLTELCSMIEKLEVENEHLKSELETATKKSQATQSLEVKACDKNEIVISKDRIEHLERVEANHSILMDDAANLKDKILRITSELTQKESELKEIQEYYECCQENLKYKKEELDDAKNIIDSMQEKMMLIENELAAHKTKDIDHNIKGNSLFAEVDDQRQQMRDLLQRQNQQYQMMKMKYSQSDEEIVRLKRENADMHDEIKECVSMFKNADKFYRSKLNEHIGFLKTENTRLSEQLKQTQLEMDNLAKTHGINWLSSMLEYCENETKELKHQLMSYGMKKCEAEGLYTQAQELAAKWRFEALKSRCIILNREMLLESNNILFEPTLKNISQMAAKLFGSSEEPIVDDFPQDDGGTSNTNDSIANAAHDDDGSWKDVKKIFETFNKQVVAAQASNRNQQQKTLVETKEERLFSKGRSNKLLYQKDFDNFKATKSDGTSKSVEDVENEEFNSNKENRQGSVDQLQSLKGSRNNGEHIKSHNINTPSSVQLVSSTAVPNHNDISKQTARLNDQTNRVRQVNVEMFTVTLKHANPPKDKQVSENDFFE